MKWKLAGIFILVMLLPAIGYGIKVAVSPAKGKGDVILKQQDATNRIFAQEHFNELFNQIEAYDRQLDQAADDKATHPGNDYYAINYSGLVKQCMDAVAQYDADARKLTQAQWRDHDLPYEIDSTDHLTDCKESR